MTDSDNNSTLTFNSVNLNTGKCNEKPIGKIRNVDTSLWVKYALATEIEEYFKVPEHEAAFQNWLKEERKGG